MDGEFACVGECPEERHYVLIRGLDASAARWPQTAPIAQSIRKDPLGLGCFDDGTATAHPELVTYVTDMAANRFRGDHQGGCNFLVGAALGQQLQHVQLTIGQQRGTRGWRREALW